MELILTTGQKLILSQKMLQSTEILQMSSQELAEYVKELALENPVVECVEKEITPEEHFDILKKKLEWLESHDEQNKIYYNEDKEETTSDLWTYSEGEGRNLTDYLLDQINVIKKEEKGEKIIKIARFIAQNLENSGYLKDSIEDIARITGEDEKSVKEALELVQSLEPAGVGATSLKECLLIQLYKREIKNPLAERIINEQLENLGKNHIHIIAKQLKAAQSDVVEACEVIKSLNPKPGNSFSSGTNLQYIIPDILVAKGEDGYEIIINDGYLPQITIGSYYKDILNDKNNAAKDYVKDKINQAQWTIKCISKRRETLRKTVEAMLSLQTDFLDKGPGNLKPMRLSDISDMIEMHESTVSRAIRDKYLQCSWGVFPLNYFFSKAMATEDADISQEKIKSIIKRIIDEEDKAHPLSDRAITEKLNEDGIKISRRTVAKYRENMNIPGATGRKGY